MNYLLWLYLTFFRTKQLDAAKQEESYQKWEAQEIVSCKKCHGGGKLSLTPAGVCFHCDRVSEGYVYPPTEVFQQGLLPSFKDIPIFMRFQLFMIFVAFSTFLYRSYVLY